MYSVLFHFYSISERNSCKQTVKTLIRCCVLRHLIWVCTVCLGPKNGMLGLYGLTMSGFERNCLFVCGVFFPIDL